VSTATAISDRFTIVESRVAVGADVEIVVPAHHWRRGSPQLSPTRVYLDVEQMRINVCLMEMSQYLGFTNGPMEKADFNFLTNTVRR
jgi:hypothetical protein